MLTNSLSSIYNDNSVDDIKHVNDIIFGNIKIVSKEYIVKTLNRLGKNIIRETVESINSESLEERLKKRYPKKEIKKTQIVKLREKFDSSKTLADLMAINEFLKRNNLLIDNSDTGRKLLSEQIMAFKRIFDCECLLDIVSTNYEKFSDGDYKGFIEDVKHTILNYNSDIFVKVKLLDAHKLMCSIQQVMPNG